MSDAAALGAELRCRLGPAPALEQAPAVSIVVVSRDGAEHLRRLLAGLAGCTDYPGELELIVVDNGSSDESLALLRAARSPFPISIVANPHNESFSDANNQGAALARGELLLFLNNDVEPFEHGWLLEMVACLQRGGPRAVGATLVFPHEDRDRFPHGFAVQHRGLTFGEEEGVLAPALRGWEADPLDAELGEDVESPVVVAACLLIEAALFRGVGGFSHGYLYGAEDVDLCLKLGAAGASPICCGRAVAIHRPGSTRRTIEFERARERKLRNRRLLWERWGPPVRRRHDLDLLRGGGIWARRGSVAAAASTAQAEAPGICVRASDPPAETPDPLELLRERAAAAGHRCLVLRGEQVDDPRGLELDVAIHLHGPRRYLPAPGQLNVLWLNAHGSDPAPAERRCYDLVLAGDPARVLDSALDAVRCESSR